jgi:hypothetical protein
MGEIKEWTLDRGLQPPVSFAGELVAHLDGVGGRSLWQSLIGGGRWHNLSVFRTREGRWIAYITFTSNVKGEIGNREVFWCDQATDLPTIFSQYQQVAFPVLAARMTGDPATVQKAAVDLMARYQQQAAKLMTMIPQAALKLG